MADLNFIVSSIHRPLFWRGGTAKDALHLFGHFLFLINPAAASVKVREYTKQSVQSVETSDTVSDF